jgi:hypothetical protein
MTPTLKKSERMTSWHLIIVGAFALVAALLVGLNWTTVSGTADQETVPEQVKVKAEQPAKRAEEERLALRDEIQKRCEKFLAKRAAREVAAGEVDEADIEDVCARGR